MTYRVWLTFAVFAQAGGAVAAKGIEFNRDIRPILSETCFACHGPDSAKRKGKLRLDTPEGARRVLVAGKPAESELHQRLTATGKRRMPPTSTGKELSESQRALIKQWIEQGAKYEPHWAFVPAKRPALPAVKDTQWARNGIDRFLLARLEKEGVRPSTEADRRTLIRRASFDLLGLPPTAKEVDAFVGDRSEKAFESLIDRLLKSKHFGERMALYWLDLVRFADTGGYHSDNHRDVALYRDWVINAFNDNKRFDRFTIEQLAGDLLPTPTNEQKIASGYNRLLQTTEEGGAQAKEYLAKYAADRVRNAGSVWLGLTLGCAECHNHKFDPVSTREFYQFASFWADISEVAVGRQPQTKILTPQQVIDREKALAAVAQARKAYETMTPELAALQKLWEKDALAALKQPKPPRLPRPVAQALAIDPAKRTPAQQAAVTNHFRSLTPALAAPRKALAQAEAELARIDKAAPQTLISMAGPPRVMRVLPRGNWLDDSGEVVTPNTPAALPALAFKGKRATRLDLANWIVSKDHPLTARVFVNRLWKLFYGQGLVTSLEDFGAQGTSPSHPELLDWLAREFVESGWDIKQLVRLMVTSAAYRQSSAGSETIRARDPSNVLLARQARFRLDAELVRDNAMAVSGLLVRKLGGASVKPYQPAGYWVYLNFPTREWYADKGDDQYRRGLYTYVQRTFPHPSLMAFDAPSREECTVERPRSNTPQQALVLLNDPTYVEAARVLAERVLSEGGKSDEERLTWAYRHVLGRSPRTAETKLLLGLLHKHHKEYEADRAAVDGLLSIGQRTVSKDSNRVAIAAWFSVTRVLLNLHETITRE